MPNSLPGNPLGGDAHGAMWADFDNDGDQDLFQLLGAARGTGSEPSRAFVNNGHFLEDKAEELGLTYPLARGRTPTLYDFDNDGFLDLFNAALKRSDGQAPATVFLQKDGSFQDAGSQYFNIPSLNKISSTLGIFFHTSLCSCNSCFLVRGDSGLSIYSSSGDGDTFEDVTKTLINASNLWTIRDVAVGDFNGDQEIDLFFVRSSQLSDATLNTENREIKFSLTSHSLNGVSPGIRFFAEDQVTFDLHSIHFNLSDIYIGSSKVNPKSKRFTLDASSASIDGQYGYRPGVDKGVFIGYDAETSRWQVFVSSSKEWDSIQGLIQSGSLSNMSTVGFDVATPPLSGAQLFLNNGNGFSDASHALGIDTILEGQYSVVSADFDNDMDLDIYAVSTGLASNRPNILYENLGDGTFAVVQNSGGAAGSTEGVGDSVTTVDFDNDGFLDIFLTNGQGPTFFADDGPYQLFRNQGNGNNWILLNLEGTISNRDGIGAVVTLTAGGVTQVREQNGGMHNFSQNDKRLHFGLADNTLIDSIEIKWPSGQTQVLRNIEVNQIGSSGFRVINPANT
jgi:hypothetical protein